MSNISNLVVKKKKKKSSEVEQELCVPILGHIARNGTPSPTILDRTLPARSSGRFRGKGRAFTGSVLPTELTTNVPFSSSFL